MSEHVSSVNVDGFNDRDPNEAPLAITEEQETEFTKRILYWSGAFDANEAAQAGQASRSEIESYMETVAPHRLGTNLERASTRTSMRYERGGMAVTCTSTGDSSRLLVEERKPHGSNIDSITRTEYVVDGPDKEVIHRSWLVDRGTNEPIDDPTEDLDDLLTFDAAHDADITIPKDESGAPSFTRGQFWDAQDILTLLEEEGWEANYPPKPGAVLDR